MKNEFIGFYNPTDKEINEAWTFGTFVFDANALLNLYRYSELTRTDFLAALKKLEDKLFLPHQAAFEFHRNRLGVIEKLEYSYDSLFKLFEANFEKNIENQLNGFKKHPSIIIEKIVKIHSEFLKKIQNELEKQKKNHPDFKTQDIVLDELTKLFVKSVGKEFTKEEFKQIFAEGKERYAELIPPGFKDLKEKQDKGERYIYGDLIIWKELINQTKKTKKPLIFVTDDRKDDWWTIENGKTLRPREELIKEFFDLTGIRILIYNADNFLKYAKEKGLIPSLKEKTIKEVKEIRIADENNYYKRSLNRNDYLDFNLPNLSSDYINIYNDRMRASFTLSELMKRDIDNGLFNSQFDFNPTPKLWIDRPIPFPDNKTIKSEPRVEDSNEE